MLKAPFPYFGGKRTIAGDVWKRLGKPKQYIEPFCGSAAMLLAAPEPCSLEVIGDFNGFIANFWRAVKHQHESVVEWADYPVSHIDLGARHKWLMDRRQAVADGLQDPDWPGDAKVAGWWLWGQCAWIGSGWCEWDSKIPHVGDAGRGIQAIGKIPHVSGAGQGHLTSSGLTAAVWLRKLAQRLERVRVIHGDWNRTLNHHYGKSDTAVFLDPPYVAFENLYGAATSGIGEIVEWCREHKHLKIALCGHDGDYDLPGWEVFNWSRASSTYGSDKTKDAEAIWFSPACLKVEREMRQEALL